jgi:hypothetical protein
MPQLQSQSVEYTSAKTGCGNLARGSTEGGELCRALLQEGRSGNIPSPASAIWAFISIDGKGNDFFKELNLG